MKKASGSNWDVTRLLGENRAVDERSGLSDAEVVDALTSDSTIRSAVFFQFLPWRTQVVGYGLRRAELLRPVSAADGVDGQGGRCRRDDEI